MFLTSRSGLGKDEELISLRRRFHNGILLLIGGGIVALIIAFSFLADRNGTLLVQADNPQGLVVLNGTVTSVAVGTPMQKLRPDTYQVSVYLEGYVSTPATRLVPVESGKVAEVSFSLEPEPVKPEPKKTSPSPAEVLQSSPARDKQTEKPTPKPETAQPNRSTLGNGDKPKLGTLKVSTVPVAGGIWLDDTFQGQGKITLTEVPLGEFIIRFDEVSGYRTPEPQKAFLTTSWPYANIEGVYLPLVYISAYLDRNGREITQKCELVPGFVSGDTEGTNDPIAGPVVKYVEETGFFAWEIGYAQSNRNPPGEDFIEMVFQLPENFAGNKPLELQLYGYSSQKRYPFALSGKTEIDIYVNTRLVKEYHIPPARIEAAASSAPDVFQINNFLQAGENRVRVKASSTSRCFYYLKQIVLL